MRIVIRNGNVATLQGPAGARQAAAMANVPVVPLTIVVADGVIEWIGPDTEFFGKADEVVDATGCLVTPGYVDAHTHLVYAGNRAFELDAKLHGVPYLEILASGGGITHTVERTKAATSSQLENEASARAQRMLQNGTTTLEAKSGYGLDAETELRMLAIHPGIEKITGQRIISTFCGAHAVPSGSTAETYTAEVLAMIPAVAEQGIAKFCDVFVEKGVFTVDQGEAILAAAAKLGMPGRLHADEIVWTGGAQLAARMKAATADHLLMADDAGIHAMQAAGTMAVLMPTVPITLMRPTWARGKKFLDAGVACCLATDHNPNNPVTDMGLVLQLGSFLLGLTPAQALTAVTWNGACALGMEDEVGSIAVGKRADILVHDVPDVDHLVYGLGRRTVRVVVSGGRVVRNGDGPRA